MFHYRFYTKLALLYYAAKPKLTKNQRSKGKENRWTENRESSKRKNVPKASNVGRTIRQSQIKHVPCGYPKFINLFLFVEMFFCGFTAYKFPELLQVSGTYLQVPGIYRALLLQVSGTCRALLSHHLLKFALGLGPAKVLSAADYCKLKFV